MTANSVPSSSGSPFLARTYSPWAAEKVRNEVMVLKHLQEHTAVPVPRVHFWGPTAIGTSKHNATEKMDTFTGTEIYMTPELFEKSRRYTDKVDMWSLGLIGMQLFTTWDPVLDGDWNPGDFSPQMRNVILPRVADAPNQLRPLLKGLLRKDPKRRWSAWKQWLWRRADNVPVRIGGPTDADDGGVVNCKKRLASTLDEDDDDRWRRSPSARPAPSAEHHSVEGSTLPNTLSPGSWVVGPTSTAPTYLDDRLSDEGDGETEESSAGSDADDWKEDDS